MQASFTNQCWKRNVFHHVQRVMMALTGSWLGVTCMWKSFYREPIGWGPPHGMLFLSGISRWPYRPTTLTLVWSDLRDVVSETAGSTSHSVLGCIDWGDFVWTKLRCFILAPSSARLVQSNWHPQAGGTWPVDSCNFRCLACGVWFGFSCKYISSLWPSP